MKKPRSWKVTADELPSEGQVVETLDSGGCARLLKRNKNLWWLADGSMYVYFTPVFWREWKGE